MPGALDINASIAAPANSATGATSFGGNDSRANFIGTIGGSNGVPSNTVLMIVAGLVAFWWFFLRKGGK